MYFCNDCKEYFETPNRKLELMGEYCGQPAYDDFPSCPNCGSDFIEDGIEECSICGSPTRNPYYCDDCIDHAKLMLKQAMKPFECEGALVGDALGVLLEAWEQLDRESRREAKHEST